MKLTNTQKINACLLATFILVAVGSYSCSRGKRTAFRDNCGIPEAPKQLAITGGTTNY